MGLLPNGLREHGSRAMTDTIITSSPEVDALSLAMTALTLNESKDKKKKKTVQFAAEEKNEVLLVTRWIEPRIHCHTAYDPADDDRHVQWYETVTVRLFEGYLEPYGHTQLHFPSTKHARVCDAYGDPADEDDAGDVVMLL